MAESQFPPSLEGSGNVKKLAMGRKESRQSRLVSLMEKVWDAEAANQRVQSSATRPSYLSRNASTHRHNTKHRRPQH